MSFVYTAVGIAGINMVAGMGAASDAADLNQETLAFAKEQYQDFKDIYGGIERNLSDFYTNLTPELIESQGLEALEKQYQQSKERMNKFFTSNEISSGVQSDLFTKGTLQNERDKATVRANAPLKAAEAKQGFLQLGLNQKTNAQNLISTTLTNQANQAQRSADSSFDAAGTSLSASLDLLEAGRDPTPAPIPIPTANSGRPDLQ